MTIYHITLWSAIVSMSKNEDDITTYSESMERHNCLITLLDICDRLPCQMLGLYVKIKIKGQLDLWSHEVGQGNL